MLLAEPTVAADPRRRPLNRVAACYERIRTTITSVSVREHTMELTAVLTHAEEGGFVALNP
jgi:hypothetical protein